MTRIECSQNQSQQINPLAELGCFVEQNILHPIQKRVDHFVKASLLVYDQFAKLVDAPPTPPKGSPHEIVLKRVENYKPWKQNRFPHSPYSQRMAEALERYTSGPIRVKPKDPKPIELPWIIQAYAEVGKLPFRAVGSLQGCNKSSGGGFVGSVDPDSGIDNHAPKFANVPPLTVQAGKHLSHIIGATDEDGDDLFFYLSNKKDLPEGITLDRETGQLSWTPTEDQVGFYQLVIRVYDGQEETYQTISIEVTAAEPPVKPEEEAPCVSPEDGEIYHLDGRPFHPVKDTTICPGIYKNIQISIWGAENVVIKGENVILDGKHVGVNSEGGIFWSQPMEMGNCTGVTITGFTFRGHTGVQVNSSNNNTFENLSFEYEYNLIDDGYGVLTSDEPWSLFILFGSDNNLLRGFKIYNGSSIYLDDGSDNNTIQDVELVNTVGCTPVTPSGIPNIEAGWGTIFDNISIEGNLGDVFSLGSGSVLKNSTIHNQCGNYAALTIDSDNEVYNNVIVSETKGIRVREGNNKIHNNDLTMTETPISVELYQPGNQIYDNNPNTIVYEE
ncbi:MAG: putative Ig domain-containing protein [Deltaproteobacteria bacterium]|nr:putative Ig domain-containing protein [Deltaproteobacteria bacterium]